MSSFFLSDEKLHFSTGIITVLLLIVTLILSETFDSLSVGKILQLSKEKVEKEHRIKEVKQENRELRENIISFATIIKNTQVQSNNSFYGLPNEFYKMIGVKQSDEESDKESDYDEEIECKVEKNNISPDEKQEETCEIPLYRLRRYMEKDGIQQFLDSINVNPEKVIYNAEFSSTFEGIDPIMDRRIRFEGYYNTADEEVFISARINNHISAMSYDRFYIMLSRILHYRKAKGVKAKLIILLFDYEGNEVEGNKSMRTERFLQVFDPALRNQLLETHIIKFKEEDINRYKEMYFK